MKNEKKLPAIVTILILTLITAIFWVFFNVYRSYTDEPDPVVPADVILPLTPKLDTDTINKIEGRLFFDTIPETVLPIEITEEISQEQEQLIEPLPDATQEANPIEQL